MVKAKLFVEGGGDSKSLRVECKKGFRLFLEKAGLQGSMIRIVASGSRRSAYEDYCTAINNGEAAFLLVDSEAPVAPQSGEFQNWNPWVHLSAREGDKWSKPKNASNTDCHLMVQFMETWLIADVSALKKYYVVNFNENALPKNDNIEALSKSKITEALKTATRGTTKGSYDKGKDSFKILAEVNPEEVAKQSQWTKRFIELIKVRP